MWGVGGGGREICPGEKCRVEKALSRGVLGEHEQLDEKTCHPPGARPPCWEGSRKVKPMRNGKNQIRKYFTHTLFDPASIPLIHALIPARCQSHSEIKIKTIKVPV